MVVYTSCSPGGVGYTEQALLLETTLLRDSREQTGDPQPSHPSTHCHHHTQTKRLVTYRVSGLDSVTLKKYKQG